MLTTVKLYGHLARKFGKLHKFSISSPAEAIRALEANCPGFKEHLMKFSEPGYHVLVGSNDLTEGELTLGITPGKTIKFIPAVVGASGKPGGLNMIIGAVLIVVGLIITGGSYGTASPFGTMVINMGIAMMVGGVAAMLAGTPKLQGPAEEEEKKNKPSYVYDGPQQTTSQGFPVPVCYGLMEIGSAVVSMGIHAEDFQGYGGYGEPASGFRIVTPYATIHKVLPSDGSATTADVSEVITFASFLNTPTATITTQSTGNYFSLTGSPGAQTLVAVALPMGTYTVILHGEDGTGTTDKTLTVQVMLDNAGDRDDNPRLHRWD